jgi:hypothetical protein
VLHIYTLCISIRRPNSYRLTNKPMTISYIWIDLAKQIVLCIDTYGDHDVCSHACNGFPR